MWIDRWREHDPEPMIYKTFHRTSCQVRGLNALTELMSVVWTDLHINTVDSKSRARHMTHYHMTHSTLASRLPHPF